jgi:hypothetical protein
MASGAHLDATFSEMTIADICYSDVPPPTSQAPSWNLEMGLLLDLDGEEDWRTCTNAQDRPGLWTRNRSDFLSTVVSPAGHFLNRLAQLCVEAKIRRCEHKTCFHRRQNMKKFAPQCEWDCFREWALTAMACQASFTDQQKSTRANTHLATAASMCHWLLIEYKQRSQSLANILTGSSWGRVVPRQRVDLTGVCELIYWMLTIQTHNGFACVIDGKWAPTFMPKDVGEDAVEKALKQAHSLRICPNRLWALTKVAERKEADLLGLVEVAQRYPSLGNDVHEKCVRELCVLSEIDSTTKTQVHKPSEDACRDRGICRQFTYPVKLLEESITSGMGSAWLCHDIRNILPGDPYIAISHVWLDGTGIGIGDGTGTGIVNGCLREYFLRIVTRLGGSAMWWDTISLPTTDVLRRKSIETMHIQYRQAECTVVHDEGLLNFDWDKKDEDYGPPCVALVLSSWFTRGWTALELYESKRVKVLYKGKDPDTPLILDLDDHLLASDPSRATRGHWIASSMIRRLRRIGSVRDMLTIMQPRITCNVDDRTAIFGLFANLKPSCCKRCNRVPDEFTRDRIKRHIRRHTTRRVLRKMKQIEHASLIHGKAPMFNSGHFSWAPEAVYEMPVEVGGDPKEGSPSEPLTVDRNGCVVGGWYYRALTQDDASKYLLPMNTSYKPNVLRVKEALKNWENCVLLREHWQDKGPALLVATIAKGTYARKIYVDGKEEDGMASCIDCRYICAVEVSNEFNLYGGDYRHSYGFDAIRLGNENGRPSVKAREVLEMIEIPRNDHNEFESEDDDEDEDDDDVDIPKDGEDEPPEDIGSDDDGSYQ